MMHDRFDAQLREHLLGTADTSPADGQLAAVVSAVSHTAQRHPLAARLTWFPGRIGPVPTRTLRFGLVAAALVGAMVAAALYAGSSPSRSTVFEGTWLSTDPGDGSEQSLLVGSGQKPAVTYIDHFASGAACRFDVVKVFTADGTGTVTDDRLQVTWPDGGGCGLETTEMEPGTYTYDESAGTIVDNKGVAWARVATGEVPPTRGPVAEPSIAGPSEGPSSLAEPTPVQDPDGSACLKVPNGGQYRGDAGPISLTVTAPSNSAVGWEARGGPFWMMGACTEFFGSEGPYIRASIVTFVDGSCELADTVAVSTPTEAVAALAAMRGVAISAPSPASLGSRSATRLDIQPDARLCYDNLHVLDGLNVTHEFTRIYIVDVGGLPLAITINGVPAESSNGLAEAEAVLASLQIDVAQGARPSNPPVPTDDPSCVQLDGSGTYTAPVGALLLSATVPNDRALYWSGGREWFGFRQSPCGFDAVLEFDTQLVTRVAVDACRGYGASVPVSTAAEAAAALTDQASTDISAQSDLTIDGNPAIRLELTVPLETDTCDEGAAMLLGQGREDPFVRLYSGAAYPIYLIDVDSKIVAISVVEYPDDDTPLEVLRARTDAIISTLQLKVAGSVSN